MRILTSTVLIVWAGLAMAQGWSEPQRGTATRAALMDALRPHAEWIMGAPVQFVVHDLRRAGNLAFASVTPQRPGGEWIDPADIPAVWRNEWMPHEVETLNMQALYVKSGETWVAVHWAIGATDVWWAWGPYCAVWRPVVPEACQGL